jgi:hypothetical protein
MVVHTRNVPGRLRGQPGQRSETPVPHLKKKKKEEKGDKVTLMKEGRRKELDKYMAKLK